MSNALATREQFLKPAKRRFLDVRLPIAGITVRIRSMFEREKEEYEARLLNSKGDVTRDSMLNARRRLIAYCLCDEDGERLLSDADIESMRDLDGADLAFLQEQCQSFVGFKSGDIEGLVKNSEAGPADNSPTD